MTSSGVTARKRGRPDGRGTSLLWSVLNRLAGRSSPKQLRAAGSRQHSHQRGHVGSFVGPRIRFVEAKVGLGKLLLILVVVAAVEVCIWHIVSDTAAENLAASSPSAALNWNGDQPQALDRVGMEELTTGEGDIATTESLARRALLGNPLDDQALLLLGMTADRKGDKATAQKLVALAGTRTWRNLTAQLWLFEHDIGGSRFDSALTHADAMLRIDPDLLQQLRPLLAAFTVDPRALNSLAAFLGTDPPWRGRFLDILTRGLVDGRQLDSLFSLLRDTPIPPKPDEVGGYLARLVRDGRFKTAHDYWQSNIASGDTAALLYNPDFGLPIDKTPFNWTLTSISGAEVAVVPGSGNKQRVLRVQFSGARVKFQNVSQILLLAPGRYVFRGSELAEGFKAERGVWWEFKCLTESKQFLGNTELISKSMPWTPFNTTFEVPAQGCAAQSLTLTVPARIESESRTEGEVRFRDLHIETAAADSGG